MKQFALLAAAAVGLAAAPATQAATFGTNLITNGDAETGDTTGFTTTGEFVVLPYDYGGGYPGGTDAGVSEGGTSLFIGGNVPLSTGAQVIDLSSLAAIIDSGAVTFDLSAYLGGYASQDDNAVLSVSFFDSASGALGTTALGPVTRFDRGDLTGLLARSTGGAVPVGTRSANVLLTFTRLQGSANDGYADNLSLVLTQGTPAVPEPASWAMLVGGFALLGGVMRRPGRAAMRFA